jgi:pimeloyl-ACP methyl ester carboxylesterase
MAAPPAFETYRLRSTDGVELACYRCGDGPALVLEPGALCDHTCWWPIWPFLSPRFTLIAFDRRGRGTSDSAADMSIEREVEDLCAVIESAGAPCYIFGHSSGALLALYAAMAGAPLRSMMLYEPPATAGGQRPAGVDDLGGELQRLVAIGDRAGAVRAFLRSTAALSDADLARLEAEPRWQSQVAMAPTLAVDLSISSGFEIDPQKLGRLRQPALLMYGESSPDWVTAPAKAIAAALPNSRLVSIPGQGHNAIFSGPAAVAGAMTEFLTEVEEASDSMGRV